MSAIDPGVDIGHVHLKVADLDRAVAFYRDVLGFELMQRFGSQAAFLSAGGYHHHIGLNTWEDRKSTRLNSSHANISYAVFCLKKKNKRITSTYCRPRNAIS